MLFNNLTFLFGLIISSYFFQWFLLKKNNSKLLIDDQFKKPQAFHAFPIPITGGLGIFLSLLLVHCYLFLFQKITHIEYFSIYTLFFILGLIDDLKINLRPKVRLILMIGLLIFLVSYNNIYIEKTGIDFLDNWISNSNFFSLFFVCLCFLFVINGANLIDGYNGLLGIHSLIIFINLFLINYLNNNLDLAYFLLCLIFILIVFVKLNFPKAKVFLGDSGSYFLGAFVAISVIKTSIANPFISPFYFCILLFYLFFEVFFSFIRKIVVEKKSPLLPDNKHLHMLLYQILYKKNKNKLKSNYYVSIVINTVYLILIIPAIFMMKNGLFCKYYSLLFFIIYLLTYKMVYEKKK